MSSFTPFERSCASLSAGNFYIARYTKWNRTPLPAVDGSDASRSLLIRWSVPTGQQFMQGGHYNARTVATY